MADAGFSEDGKYFSSIANDGRLRIWDTETSALKHEYTPDLHLTSPPTCLQWITASQSPDISPLTKKWQNRTDQRVSSFVALGTKSGNIVVYSVTQGKVECVLSAESARGVVAALDWQPQHGLFSCGRNALRRWDLRAVALAQAYTVGDTGTNIHAIKILPHCQEPDTCYVLTSSSEVVLWRLQGATALLVRRVCSAHRGSKRPVLALVTLGHSSWLIHGSQTERLLSVYEVPLEEVAGESGPAQSKRRKSGGPPSTPHCSLLLEQPPRMVHATVNRGASGMELSAAAVTAGGVLHYYTHQINGATSKPLKAVVTLEVVTPEPQPLRSVACRLRTADTITIAYQNTTQLVFEDVKPDVSTQTQLIIRGEERPTGGKKRGVKEKGRNKETVADEHDVTVLEPMGGVARKRGAAGGKMDVPMEERLANLSMSGGGPGGGGGGVAVAHNMSRLLAQGLRSDDDKLISTVLSTSDSCAAAASVSSLSAQSVPALVPALAARAASGTRHCACAAVWARALLARHAALLLASADTQKQLSALLATLAHRRSHLCQLLNLRGRLQLTATQRRDGATQQHQPVLEYHDDTSSDSEVEGELERPSDSEGEREGSWADSGDSGGE